MTDPTDPTVPAAPAAAPDDPTLEFGPPPWLRRRGGVPIPRPAANPKIPIPARSPESADVNPTVTIDTATADRRITATIRCPGCSYEVDAADRFCESCGRELGARRVALPTGEPLPDARCDGCDGTAFDADGYCEGCGGLRPEPDRFEADLGTVCLVTDRGIAHARNEDAVAAAVLDEGDGASTTVIVVSDGVSTSEDPQAASGAACRAGVEACVAALREGRDAAAASFAGLAAAAQAVREVAVVAGQAPSCTYVSAIVRGYGTHGVEITVANVGDSRAYWLRGEVSSGTRALASQRLTVDDSYAQALVDAGAMDERSAMNDPRAHTLLRWLGADSGPEPWSDSCVRTFRTGGPGLLLLCTDGLWNYRPDPAGLAGLAVDAETAVAARALVDFAMCSGGNDNITVALAPVPAPDQPGEQL
ncbi:serine/threonine-protein phosphatase [Nocardia arizonensis]|uniref:serine/threonine-protein phosphatase n=1 Tax=Nocardia arizonensis TaxID=1141647 RepID=UPI0006D16C2F|nr:serine/threonine-protein phosphatase [Nocardia arizonensis]